MKPRDWESLILFEDNHCLVVNKPSGIWCAGSSDGPDTIESQLKEYIKEKYQKPGNVFLTLVHRIDRPTSGCVLLAKTSKAASRLAEAFRTHEVKKIYLAKVHGQVKPQEAQWIDWLVVDEKLRKTRIGREGEKDAQKAILNYKISDAVKVEKDFSLLEIHLQTGRKHQIRAQCAGRKFPIVGDTKYGSDMKVGENRILLHSWKMSFKHPTRGENIEVIAGFNW